MQVATKETMNACLPVSKEENYTGTRGQKLSANNKISDFQNKMQ